VHACGLVHRDLKPRNIIMADDGPRIIDFGIARAADATVLTSSGVVIGTFSFMSPEQVSAQHVGPASDVFSLGSVLAFAATGRAPFDPPTIPAILQRIAAESPELRGISGPLHAIISACLAKDPASRPSLADLIGRLSGSPMSSPTPTVTAPPQVLPWSPPPVQSQPPPIRQQPPPIRQPTWIRTEPPAPRPVRPRTQPRRQHRLPPAATPRARKRGRFLKPLIGAVVVIVVAGAVTAWILSRPKWIPGPGVAYVTNDRGIVPVNLTTGQAGHPIAVRGTTYGIALDPQDGTAYVIDQTTCHACAGTVGISNLLPVNLTTGSTGNMTAVNEGSAGSGNEAFLVVLSRNGKIAYVMNGSGVVPVNLATGRKGPTIGVGNATSQIAISPDGRTLYVTTSDGYGIVPVNLRTGSIGTGINISSRIMAIAPAPAGGNVYLYDAGGIASVNPVARRVNWQTTSAELGDGGATAGSLVVMPDGLTAYAGGAGTGVVPINLRTHQVGQLISLNDSVSAIVASPDGKIVYVGGWSGAVYPINVATNQVGKAASTGSSPALQSMTVSS
jgi:Protein kinase domain